MTTQTTSEARIAEQVVRLYELRKQLADAVKVERELTAEIKGWMAEDGADVLDVEGAPVVRLKSRQTGRTWDSDAVRNLIEKQPQTWRKLVELGCVGLKTTVIQQAIKGGQLVAMPEGSVQGTAEYLVFEGD